MIVLFLDKRNDHIQQKKNDRRPIVFFVLIVFSFFWGYRFFLLCGYHWILTWILAQSTHGANALYYLNLFPIMWCSAQLTLKSKLKITCFACFHVAESLHLLYSFSLTSKATSSCLGSNESLWSLLSESILKNQTAWGASSYTEHAAAKIAQFEATRQDFVSQKREN